MFLSVEHITSRQNPLLVLATKLLDKKHRDAEGIFRFDGKKLCYEAVEKGLPLVALILKESAASTLLDGIKEATLPADCRVVALPDALFLRLSEEKAPEGVICLCRRLSTLHTVKAAGDTAPLEGTGRMLFLEGIQDPGNLGTMIRSARAFGVERVVLSPDCADIYHPRTLRAAMGALFSQCITVAEDFVGTVKEQSAVRRVFAATLNDKARRLDTVAPRSSDAVIIGNEGHGIQEVTVSAATDSVYIPMDAGVESLNAGVAAAVVLWEFYRAGE